MDLKWNDNGNWLVTASRDHLLKLFDLRNLREEVQVFRGHKKEASAVAWHPVHEGLFSSGGSDGSILFWNVGSDKEVGAIDAAHDSIVWTLAWHPLGHILCSGSNDHTIKFWTRNRPGDQMRDKYNLNTLPAGLQGMDECEIDDHNITIPGMGPEDKIDFTESLTADRGFIPGLDLDTSNLPDNKDKKDKKVPYSKPIPRNFQAQWNDTGNRVDDEESASKEIKDVITQIVENKPGVPSGQSVATAIVVYNRVIDVIRKCYVHSVLLTPMNNHFPDPETNQKFFQFTAGSRLEKAIAEGPEALNRFINAGEVEQLNDIVKRNDQNEDEPTAKRSRFDRVVNHNAQIIYKDTNNGASQSNSFIPPLMALSVDPELSNMGSNDGFRMSPGDMHGWPAVPPPGPPVPPPGAMVPPLGPPDNWAPPPMFGPNGQMNPMNSQPPSLLNLNLAPPFGEMPPNNWPGPPGNFNRNNMSGGNMGGNLSGDSTNKRRNRDSEGNRISRFDREGGDRPSRFDNNDNNGRNRRGGGSGGNWIQNKRRL